MRSIFAVSVTVRAKLSVQLVSAVRIMSPFSFVVGTLLLKTFYVQQGFVCSK